MRFLCLAALFFSFVGCGDDKASEEGAYKKIYLITEQEYNALPDKEKKMFHPAYSSKLWFDDIACIFTSDELMHDDDDIVRAVDKEGNKLYTNLTREEQNDYCCEREIVEMVVAQNRTIPFPPDRLRQTYPCFD